MERSFANFVSESSVFDFPFLFPSSEVADKVLDGEVGQSFLDKLEDQNLVGLAYWENGFRNLTNNKTSCCNTRRFQWTNDSYNGK